LAAFLVGAGAAVSLAQEKAAAPPTPPPTQAPTPQPTANADSTAAQAKQSPEQLESLVAPIALYPDDLLAQTLVASTYPLEIVQLQQWLAKHKDLKDKALADSVAKQSWDPSIQSMAVVPDVVERLANDIEWTTDLGNAFLAQQADVMDAVQSMRKKAQETGALASNEQQKVETKVVEEQTIIIVESANPEVIYVPSYSPTVVYGAPPYYPYPPIYYPPPPPPGAAFVAFSVGVMWGAAYGGSCCGCGWGGNDVNINVDNNFNQINHYGGGGGGNSNWQHNPQHRGAAPYGDKATASKYQGSQNKASAGTRPSTGQSAGKQPAGAKSTAGTAGVSSANRGGTAKSQAGGDQIGNHSVSKSSGSKGSSGLSSGSGGYSGSSARASSARGAASTGSRGGGSRGGGRR
jgi:hypothetical protein